MRRHLTIDVEAPAHLCRMEDAAYNPGEVLRHVEEALAFLEGLRAEATFFILGDAAKREPRIARAIAAAGHEAASHGYLHRPVHRLSIAEFGEDLRRSKGVLEDILGRPVFGYRSPAWTLGLAPAGYHDEVYKTGYLYSSSILPATGFAPFHRGASDGREFPPCVWSFGLFSVPAGTSWMFRLMPVSRLRRHLETEGRHVVVFHSHEFAGERPASSLGPGQAFIRHAGPAGFRDKMSDLLGAFVWTPLASALDGAQS